MARPDEDGFVVQAMFVAKPQDAREKAETLRCAVTALKTFEGEALVGEDLYSKAFLAGGDAPEDLTVLLTNSRFKGLWEREKGWITLSILDDGQNQPTYIFLTTNIGPPEDQISRQWDVGIELSSCLVTALDPQLGFINGKPSGDETFDALPAASEMPETGLPGAITPWTYIRSDRLQNTACKQWVARLPAHKLTNLRHGVAIQIVGELGDPPASDLLRMLSDPACGKIRYIAPRITKSGFM